MLVTADKPYRCDNPNCPTGAVVTPMEKIAGLGFDFDFCGALVCWQYFAGRFNAEASARFDSDRAVAAQAAKEAQADADAAAALGPKAAAQAQDAQAAATAAAQAAADAAGSPGPADGRARALAAARLAAQALEAAHRAAGV